MNIYFPSKSRDPKCHLVSLLSDLVVHRPIGGATVGALSDAGALPLVLLIEVQSNKNDSDRLDLNQNLNRFVETYKPSN